MFAKFFNHQEVEIKDYLISISISVSLEGQMLQTDLHDDRAGKIFGST